MSDFVSNKSYAVSGGDSATKYLTETKNEGGAKFTFFWASSANGAAQLINATVATFVPAFMTDVMLIPAPILLTFFSVLMWLNPNLPTVWKAIFFLVMYIGYGMTTTMYTMPHVALLPACVKKR